MRGAVCVLCGLRMRIADAVCVGGGWPDMATSYALAIAGGAGLGCCGAIARMRCAAGVAVRGLRLRSEFR